MEEKHKHYKAFLTDQKSVRKKALYVNSRKTVQRELRKMQDVWYSNKADEIQSYADSNNMKDFYASLKSVYGQALPLCFLQMDIVSSLTEAKSWTAG